MLAVLGGEKYVEVFQDPKYVTTSVQHSLGSVTSQRQTAVLVTGILMFPTTCLLRDNAQQGVRL